jgi:hypothetical protein
MPWQLGSYMAVVTYGTWMQEPLHFFCLPRDPDECSRLNKQNSSCHVQHKTKEFYLNGYKKIKGIKENVDACGQAAKQESLRNQKSCLI